LKERLPNSRSVGLLLRALGTVALLLTACNNDQDEVVAKATRVPVMQYRPDPGQPEDRARALLIREVRNSCVNSRLEPSAVVVASSAGLDAREGYWEGSVRSSLFLALAGATPAAGREDGIITMKIYPDGLVAGDFITLLSILCIRQ